MIVRDAVEADWPDIFRIGRAFTQAAGMPEVDIDTLAATLESVSILKVAESDGEIVGSIAVLVFPSYWNRNHLLAQELWWWVDPHARSTRAGRMLLDAAEEDAALQGARRLLMLCLDDMEGDRVAMIYKRRGYKPQERTYSKELRWQ